jgi:hypothetical protein
VLEGLESDAIGLLAINESPRILAAIVVFIVSSLQSRVCNDTPTTESKRIK